MTPLRRVFFFVLTVAIVGLIVWFAIAVSI
jgi:hypothetical protein